MSELPFTRFSEREREELSETCELGEKEALIMIRAMERVTRNYYDIRGDFDEFRTKKEVFKKIKKKAADLRHLLKEDFEWIYVPRNLLTDLADLEQSVSGAILQGRPGRSKSRDRQLVLDLIDVYYSHTNSLPKKTATDNNSVAEALRLIFRKTEKELPDIKHLITTAVNCKKAEIAQENK